MTRGAAFDRDAVGRALRVMVLNPVGHVLGAHDRAISAVLAAAGHEVVLGSNSGEVAVHGAAYRCFEPYAGIVGDASRAVKAANYVRAMGRIVREARSFRPDVVLLYWALQPHLDWLLLRRLAALGIRTMVCAHDVLPLDRDADRFGGYRGLYHAASQVIVLGQFARGELVRRLGYPQSRVRLAYLGIDHVGADELLGRARARALLGLGETEQVVLCIGNIKPTKGVPDLIDAFPMVAERHPDAVLHVLGRPQGVDPEDLRARARAAGIHARFRLGIGHLPEHEFVAWIEGADVVVHPDWRLYQSGVIQQASALGRPIVATEVGNVGEVLRDGESAWLVPAHQPRRLAQAIGEALADPREAERRGRRARADTDRSTWASVARAIVQDSAGAAGPGVRRRRGRP